MVIKDVSAVRRELPVQGLKTSYGTKSSANRSYVFVRITTDSGISGFGEAACLTPFTGETPGGVEIAISEYISELLVGRSPFNIEAIHREVERLVPKNSTAMAAVDIALHDVLGKALGVPVASLLGGAVYKKLKVAEAVGIEDPDYTATLAKEYVNKGFTTIKLKVGQDFDRDVAAVAGVREAVGPNVDIRLDANQGLIVSEAYRFIRAIEKYHPQYVEQPVAVWDSKALGELRLRTGVPIAADESVLGIKEAIKLLEERAVDYFVVKLIKCGGLYPAKTILRLADLYRVPCTVTSPFETSIGTAANLQIAATHARLSGAIEVGDPTTIPGDPARGLSFAGGEIEIPSGPGLGIEVSDELFTGEG